MSWPPLTLAQREAIVLRAVSNHLLQHPHLPPVVLVPSIDGLGGLIKLQVTHLDQDLHHILAWASSIGADSLLVKRGRDHFHVHAEAQLSGVWSPGHGYLIGIAVWDAVDSLISSSLAHGDRIAVGDLIAASAIGTDLAAALASVRGPEATG